MATAAAHTPPDASHAPMTGPLRCLVVTPEKTVLDQRAEFIAIPLHDGELGVLPGRAPLVGRLGFGELRTRSGDKTRFVYIDGGFAQVRDDVVTILTNRALPVDEVQPERAREQLARANAERAAGDEAIEARRREADRARAQIRAARHSESP
jgi:F-type H+-transporting ATPase subunit epsilon